MVYEEDLDLMLIADEELEKWHNTSQLNISIAEKSLLIWIYH